MPKIVALQYPASRLAGLLAQKGYRVVDLYEAFRLRTHVDAVLYSVRQPEAAPDYHGLSAAADISLGDYMAASDGLPGAVTLNIAGRSPEAVVEELGRRLRQRQWRY